MNCLIVDDNKIALTTLRQMISMDPSLTLVGECGDAAEAHRLLLVHHVDLIFLDIEMPEMSGIELVKSLEGKRPMIIFTTSDIVYAAEAFDLNVVDFITKPIVPGRFFQAVEKAKELKKMKSLYVAANREEEFIFIRDSNIIRRIRLKDILYLEAMGDYVKIYSLTANYTIHSSLKAVEQKISATIFLRVHRSFIINLSKIDTIEGGTLIINHNLVPVSDAYRAALNKRMLIL
ncbi:LytR/AlgR family response regulator transcription factor [Pedobacter metabolipauper]|uniref:LytTR family two component transcriptional regulator n=1 Tax=Pedobacter metabolipauper TaxID=425513 RepID=A0A4R6SYV0_9SPHI|nr:LytTR family DNA-binding domain-containing protein [Pedobacter metabolipauper]TDQ09695.1 LytTR family two component transcriptional regulator [Pedobacter metabolipauper]